MSYELRNVKFRLFTLFTKSILLICWVMLLLVACGGTTEALPTPARELTEQELLGKQVFTRECATCHSLSAGTTLVGPPLASIATTAATRISGQDAHAYILNSIMRPGDYIVEGYSNTMPDNFGRRLTGEQIDAVVAYLLTLE
jgi:mono/diheme cytochrome c family protein